MGGEGVQREEVNKTAMVKYSPEKRDKEEPKRRQETERRGEGETEDVKRKKHDGERKTTKG